MSRPLVLFVDIDDTLVRSTGSKRIPMTPVIAEGAVRNAWSSGGADSPTRHVHEPRAKPMEEP